MRAQEPVLEAPRIEVRIPRLALDPAALPYAVSIRRVAADPPMRLAASLEEVLRGVPGLQVDDRHNHALGERLSIRGFGARTPFGVRGIKVLVDGLPATLPDGQTALTHVDPARIGSVTVLRGPTASFYGNAAGGVIELRSIVPPAGLGRQELRVDLGGSGYRRLLIATSGRSGGTRFGVHASEFRIDGYRTNSEASVRRASFALRREARGAMRLQATFVDYEAENPGALTAEQLEADPEQAQAINLLRRTGERGRQLQAGLLWSGQTPVAEVEAVVHGTIRGIDNPIPIRIVDLSRRAGGMRVVARRPEVGRRFAWAAGWELDAQRDDRRNFQNRDGRRGAVTLSQVESVVAAGAFVHTTVALGSRLSLSGAGRHDWIRFQADDRHVGAGEPDDSGDRTLAAFSPSLGWTLALGKSWSLYGSASSAFEAPTTTELANRPDGTGGLNPDLQPQQTHSFELGGRRFASDGWIEAAVYRARVEDALIPFEVPGAPGRAYFRNAGSAVHRGLEVAAGARFARGLTGALSYAWTDARFDRFAVADSDHAGKRVPGVAPHRLDLALGLSIGRASAGLELRAVGETPVDDANTAAADPYELLNLRLGVESAASRAAWSLTVGVTNLTDERHVASVVINAAGSRYFEPGPSRSFYAVLRLQASGALTEAGAEEEAATE